MAGWKTKALAIVALGGIAVQFGGCLGSGVVRRVVTDAALAVAYEFVWDNDSVFDLFQDDFGTATFYNDRLTDDPTRAELAEEELEGLVIEE